MRTIFCITLFSLLVSCSSDDEVPRDIIPIPQMKFIMFDVITAQEAAGLTFTKDTTALKQKTFELYQQVFAIYKISRGDFFKSFHYYEANPDKIKVLYDSLTAYANRKRQELYQKLK